MRRRPGRPQGEVALALKAAAATPATVRELAKRAKVGYKAAAVTACRLRQRGELIEVSPGRPAVLRLAEPGRPVMPTADRQARAAADLAPLLALLGRR